MATPTVANGEIWVQIPAKALKFGKPPNQRIIYLKNWACSLKWLDISTSGEGQGSNPCRPHML